MTNVKIRIEVNPNAESENLGDIQNQVDGIPSSENVSNVSVKITGDGLFQEIPNKRGGINGLSLASNLVFDENGLLDNSNLQGAVLESTESPVEFIWGVVPDNGEYKVRLVFTDAKSLKDVIIYGDSVVNQFPTQATIDGKTVIYNDDLEWAINLGEESDTHIIEFTHWNKTNYNACISKIAVMLKYLEIDKNNGLKEIESTSQSSSDTSGLYYGSIENFGAIEIVDKSGELVEMIRDGVIDNSNTNLEVLANNQVIQNHISTDSSYDNNTKVLSLELGNKINSLDVLKYKGYDYPDHEENLATLLFDVLSNLKYVIGTEELTQEMFVDMLADKYDANQTLYEYLNSCTISYPFIEANKTYREVIDEFCLIAQMQMYIDDGGNIKFVSARPKVFDVNNQAIHIPKGNMFSQLEYNLILKNKYDGVEATKTNVIKKDDFNTPVFTSDKINLFSGGYNLFDLPEINNLNSPFYSKIVSNTYVYIRNVYYSDSIQIYKKRNQNLEQVISIKDSLVETDENGNKTAKYKLSCSYNSTDNYLVPDNEVKFTFNNGEITNITGKLVLGVDTIKTDRIKATQYVEDYGEVSIRDETESEEITISDFGDYYLVSVKILVGQQKIKCSALDGSHFIELEYYNPNSLEYSIYGTTRTIEFNQVQANTNNIDVAKTKVSLNSSNLIQTDEIINKIKSNILNDYKQGVSSANVTISCNNYYDSNGNKIVDWTRGEIPKLNQSIYFDNDLYANKSQRYWKIKGRTFRKTGVPMLDLELEEVKKRELKDYSWAEISELSNSGKASDFLSLGETKKFELTDGRELTAMIIGFNYDKTENDSTAGITFIVTDLNEQSAMGESGLPVEWSTSIVRQTLLPSVYNLIPFNRYIKNIKKKSLTWVNITTTTEETIDKLWLISPDEITKGVAGFSNEVSPYNYLFDNVKNIANNVENDWWLRGRRSRNVGGIPRHGNFYWNKNYESTNIVNSIWEETDPSVQKNIVFGFCI